MFGAPDFYFNYIQWFDCDQVTQRLSTEVVTRSKEITIKKEGTRDSLLDRECRQCLWSSGANRHEKPRPASFNDGHEIWVGFQYVLVCIIG